MTKARPLVILSVAAMCSEEQWLSREYMMCCGHYFEGKCQSWTRPEGVRRSLQHCPVHFLSCCQTGDMVSPMMCRHTFKLSWTSIVGPTGTIMFTSICDKLPQRQWSLITLVW